MRMATTARQQIDQYTANLARTFSQLGKEINNVTGYGEIEELKRRVGAQGEPTASEGTSLALTRLCTDRGADRGGAAGSA